MPIARALAGQMASEIFERPESAGFEIVREAHAQGLIEKGTGGGFGSTPEASSRDGVLLYLALFGWSKPSHAIKEAAVYFNAPYSIGGPGKLYETFGQHLSWLVHCYRARIMPLSQQSAAHVSVGWFRDQITAQVGFVADSDIAVIGYSLDLAETLNSNPGFAVARRGKHGNEAKIGFDGSALSDIARLLGHLGDDVDDDIGGPLPASVLDFYATQELPASTTRMLARMRAKTVSAEQFLRDEK